MELNVRAWVDHQTMKKEDKNWNFIIQIKFSGIFVTMANVRKYENILLRCLMKLFGWLFMRLFNNINIEIQQRIKFNSRIFHAFPSIFRFVLNLNCNEEQRRIGWIRMNDKKERKAKWNEKGKTVAINSN